MAEASTFVDVPTFLAEIVISDEDGTAELLQRAKDALEVNLLIDDDKWLSRADNFGQAGAMDRHIEFLGLTLLPNAEAKLNRMTSKGIIGESYVRDSWFGETNEQEPHVSEETPFDQLIENQQNFVDQLKRRMTTAGIKMVVAIHNHDILSNDLEQLTYAGIKAKAAANRMVAAKKTATG